MSKKIMIVEDDPGIIDAMQMMLEMRGYEVVTCSNLSALETIPQEEPDLLFLDIWMPGIDGREICVQLKAKKETQDLPVVMVSANKDTKTIAQESGADAFLEKPFDMDDLIAMAEQYAR